MNQLNYLNMHPNSLEAFFDKKAKGSRMNRRQMIIGLMLDDKERTDRQIMNALGFTDMNNCRPRISEMIKDPDNPMLEECGNTIDPATNKKVRIVRIISNMGEK